MSLSLNPVIPIRCVDPALNFDDNRYYSVTTGAEMVSYKPIVSTSYSTSSISFTCPPPSPLIAVHNKAYISIPIKLTFTADVPADNLSDHTLLQDGLGALRAYPFESICVTATSRINNNSNTVSYSDIIPYITRYNTDFNEREYEYSCFPSYMDQSSNYDAVVSDAISPLNSYGIGSYGTPRGAFPYVACNNPSYNDDLDATAQLSFVITSPIWISPFGFGRNSDNKCALIGVSTMDFTFTLAHLERLWSSATIPGITDGAGNNGVYKSIKTEIGAPAMLFRYLSPKLLQSIPRSLTYSYTLLDRFPSARIDVPAFKSSTFTSNNLQINTIPRRVYIFVRKSNSAIQASVKSMIQSTDTFLPITHLEVNYNNNSGLLSSATPYDLWNISKKNGVNISFPAFCGSVVQDPTIALPIDIEIPSYENPGIPLQFVKTNVRGYNIESTVGSIVALDWAVDVGLSDIHAPDQIFNSQLYIKATVVNPTAESINCEMYIITCTSGTLTIENLQAIANIGVLSKEDVVNARQKEGIVYSSRHSIYGGDLASSLKKFGKQAASAVKTAVPYVKKGIDGVSKAANAASKAVDTVEGLTGLFGLGYHGGVNSGGAYAGGAYAGGRRISRSELQHKLGM